MEKTSHQHHLNRKLIVTDLDGTLLNNDEQVTKLTVDTIKTIISKGHIVCIATGRPLRSSIHIYKKLGLKTIIANLNGSIITNPTDKSFMPINLTFSKSLVKSILSDRSITNHVGCVLIENMDGAYIVSNNLDPFISKEFLKKFHIDESEEIQYLTFKDANKITKDINSILIYIKDKKKMDELSFKIKGITSTLIVRSWSVPHDEEGTVLEINSIFSNKGTTLKFLSSYYAVPLHNCYTFGDGENDLEMIRTGINGYAMKNGKGILKLIANKITQYDNDNDGVARELIDIFNLMLPKI